MKNLTWRVSYIVAMFCLLITSIGACKKRREWEPGWSSSPGQVSREYTGRQANLTAHRIGDACVIMGGYAEPSLVLVDCRLAFPPPSKSVTAAEAP